MNKPLNKIEKLIAERCPEGVEFKELREFALILNGYAFKSSEYSNAGIRVIRISDVQKGKMSDKELKYWGMYLTQVSTTYSVVGYGGRLPKNTDRDGRPVQYRGCLP